MNRQKFVRPAITLAVLSLSSFFPSGSAAVAKSLAAPVLPLNVDFRFVPEYLEQSISDDPRYARIEALLDGDGCHVILLDKTSDREAFYSSSKRRVDALTASGSDAYVTPIEFKTPSPTDASPTFFIRFRDRFGNEISWKFVAGTILAHASPKVISRTVDSGVIFLYTPRRAPSVDGTKLTIAGRGYPPKPVQPDNAPGAFYAIDMTLAEIMPGTELWEVESSPEDFVQAAKWHLAGGGGRQRTLFVKELSGPGASIEQVDARDPDAPRVVLNLVQVNDGYELRSVSMETHFNTLWIFFGPALPLPAHQAADKRVVTFTVAENEQENLASGKLEVRRAIDVEHALWCFDRPSFARGITLETGVNLISSIRAQANSVTENRSAKSPLEH